MNCNDLKDLILFHAGGVAEEEESREVLRHLESGCPRCIGHLAESRATLSPLPLAVEPVRPSPAVRERLMAAIAAIPSPAASASSSARGERAPLRSVAGLRTSRKPGGDAGTDPDWERSGRFVKTWVLPALAAGLAAAFAGLAVYTPMNHERLAMQARMAQQEGQLRILKAEVQNATRVLKLLRSPSVQVVSLAGAETPRAAGRILWDRSRGEWHLFAADLKPPGPGRTYQLWFITADHRMVSAGTFDVDESGEGELVAAVPGGLEPIALAAVTDEPAGGMPQPTGKIQIKGAIPPASSSS